MDAPVYQWFKRAIKPLHTANKSILEVGSQDVNGSIRSLVHNPKQYLGVDMTPGPGVDRMVNVQDLETTFGPNSWDVVISTEMLEHVQDWKHAIHAMKAVLRPGGLLILTTRRPGFPRHCHPYDHWRFTPAFLMDAFQDFSNVNVVALAGKGVALTAKKPNQWKPKPFRGSPIPAPINDLTGLRHWLWVKLAYHGRRPNAR